MNKKNNDRLEIAIEADLVGIKNLKSTHAWRLELDVYEKDNYKVKDLFDLIDMPISVGIIGKKNL